MNEVFPWRRCLRYVFNISLLHVEHLKRRSQKSVVVDSRQHLGKGPRKSMSRVVSHCSACCEYIKYAKGEVKMDSSSLKSSVQMKP